MFQHSPFLFGRSLGSFHIHWFSFIFGRLFNSRLFIPLYVDYVFLDPVSEPGGILECSEHFF